MYVGPFEEIYMYLFKTVLGDRYDYYSEHRIQGYEVQKVLISSRLFS